MSSKSKSEPEVWIRDAILCTQDSGRSVRKGSLRIVGRQIAEIRRSVPSKISKNARIINAAGLTVLPGFVQAHMHLCQTLFRNMADDMELLDWLSRRIWKFEAAHTAHSLEISALLGIHELLSSGTTCILDMGTVRHTESIFKAVLKTGIRANVGKCLMDHPELTPPNLRESSDAALKEALDLYRKWNGRDADRIRASFAPRFALSCTRALLEKVGVAAGELGALIHTHASENLKEVELVRNISGKGNVDYFKELGLLSNRLVLAHCVWAETQEKEMLRDSDVKVVHCPSSNLKLASGIAPVPELREMGICVALGADGAPCNNHLDAFQEMRLAGLIQKPRLGPKSMRAPEVLDMATREGARALDWFNRIGSIEVGKEADLVAIDLNQVENLVASPLDLESIASSIVYSSQPTHVRYTLVAGKTVYSKGRVQGIDRVALIRKAQQARRNFQIKELKE